MSKELTTQADADWTREQVDLIKNTVAKGASDNELKLFMQVAKRSGLDPFTKQVHFVKRGTTGTIQTGIDGYRAIAAKTGDLAGIDDAVYDSEEKPFPNKASVTVYRMVQGQRVGFTASARWGEYCPIYNGRPSNMWEKMPYLMLAKCAEALALRKAFPNDLSGLYTNEEMAQAANDNEPSTRTMKHVQYDEDDEPIVEALPMPKNEVLVPFPSTTVEKKLAISALVRKLGHEPEGKEAWENAVFHLCDLALVEKNYDQIITALEIKLQENGSIRTS